MISNVSTYLMSYLYVFTYVRVELHNNPHIICHASCYCILFVFRLNEKINNFKQEN